MQNDFEGENVAGLPSLDQLEFSEAEVRFSPSQNDLSRGILPSSTARYC